MSERILTKEQDRYIRENRLLASSGQIAKHVGCSKSFIQRYLSKNWLKPPKDVVEEFRVAGLTGLSTSTPKIDKYLKAHYLNIPEKPLAVKVGKSSTFVRRRLRQLGLVIPRDIIAARVAASRIQSGSAPFNKGRKMKEWMPPASIKRSKATRFKKGNLPKNTLHDLAITVRLDNRGVKMLFIRVGLAKWLPLQRYAWERANGPIPGKMKIVFKNGNTLDCNIENLEMVTPADLMRRNTVHNYGPEIAKIAQLRGALNRQINKHLKKIRNEK